MDITTVNTRSYLNTLMFCILCIIIAIGILCTLLLAESTRQYSVGALTLMGGIMLIVILTLISVMKNDRDLTKNANMFRKNAYQIVDCPHYFTQSGTSCENRYTIPDDPIGTKITFVNTKTYEDLPKIDLEGPDLKDRKLSEICDHVEDKHKNHPWTDLKAKCRYMA